MATLGVALGAALLLCGATQDMAAQPDRDPTSDEVAIPSSIDGNKQRAIVRYPAANGTPAPLLVHLHSWSGNYRSSSGMEEAQREANARGWIFLSPDFRGANDRPEACASDLAISDVIDAVRYVEKTGRVDKRRIYLVGASGGGHMALMMASRHPRPWAAVSAWVPISDLAAWHEFTREKGLRYAAMIEKCCGGAPGGEKTAGEYRRRSPVTQLRRAAGLPLAIHVGIHDGHTGSVPVRHSLLAFNELASANGVASARFSDSDIDFMTQRAELPLHLKDGTVAGRFRSKHRVLLHRQAGPAALFIFDGGHESDFAFAAEWLASPTKR